MADAEGHKADRRAEIIATTCCMLAFSGFFLFARIYTRIFASKAYGWDDTFLLISYAATLAGEGLLIEEVIHGLGLPVARVELADFFMVIKYTTFAIFCNGIAMGTLKTGIGLSLLRLRLSKYFNWAVIASIVLSLLINLIVFPGTFGICTPLRKMGNIVTDLLFTLGPLYYVSTVKVSMYNKWALRGVFLIGLLATVCAIAKATQLPQITKKNTDPTYAPVTLTILVIAEYSAGLFAASLPALKATFERVLSRLYGITTGFTTPSATRSREHTNNNSHTPHPSRRPPPGSAMGAGFEDDYPHSPATHSVTFQSQSAVAMASVATGLEPKTAAAVGLVKSSYEDDSFESLEKAAAARVLEKYRGTATDKRDMSTLGYRQVLRAYGCRGHVMVGWMLISPSETFDSLFTFVLTDGGTALLFWGFIACIIGQTLVYASISEVASMSPTAGGQYHCMSEFSPARVQKVLSYLTGWLLAIGWQVYLAGICSMVGSITQGLIALNVQDYVWHNWHGTLLTITVIVFSIIFNTAFAH
ncbi:hypothetical protein DV736_g6268, partial [Chaetothyriales sp. CBS 134916]